MPCSRSKRLFLCSIAVLGLSACTSLHAPPPVAEDAGMHAVDLKDGAARRVAGPVRWSALDVSAVAWAASAEIDPAERERLRTVLQAALQRDLAPASPPEGPAIRVQARILDVAAASPALNVMSTLLLFVPIDRGGASVEIDAVDATTGRRLATLTLAASGQFGEFSAHFSRFGHAEDVLRRSATVFRQLLEKENEPDNRHA